MSQYSFQKRRKMAQGNKGSTPRQRPDKRKFRRVAKKLRDPRNDEIPDASKASIHKPTARGDKLMSEVLKSG